MRGCSFAVLAIIFSGCGFSNKTAKKGSVFQPSFIPGPLAFIYKTKGDYRNLAAVTLNDSGNRIVSYPSASDISLVGPDNIMPVKLRKGYLLSKGTVSPNTAFLSITWKEYSILQNLTHEKIMSLVKYRNPFTEMYNAGLMTDVLEMEKSINRLIKDNQLKIVCKRLI